jgi:hypothetical protein
MAISYSASASDKFTGVSSTRTLSITVNSGDTRMIAGIFANGGSGFTASYNGSSMTAVTSRTNGAYTMYVFELVNPTSGTHDITCNWTGSINGVMIAATYQGDNTSVAISNFASASAATVNITAITGWTVLLSGNHHTGTNTMIASTGSTERSISAENTDHDVAGIFDSNAQVAGATSMASSASGATYASVIVTIPVLIASSILDNITILDSQNSNMGQSFIDIVNADDGLVDTDWETKAKSTAPTWTNTPKS